MRIALSLDSSHSLSRFSMQTALTYIHVADHGAFLETADHTLLRYSMLRMALAPCAPFNVTKELMVKAARLARQHPGVRLHTHLAENQEDIDFSQSAYGCRPGEYIR